MALPDIDALTQEETTELAGKCLSLLPLNVRVEVVSEAFARKSEKAELISWLEEGMEEEEEEE